MRVLVLDRQQPGKEASWAAAGMLSPAPDSPRDIPLVPLGRESLRLYQNFISAIEENSGQSAGYARDGAIEIFFGPHGESERDARVAECTRLGIAAEPLPIEAARARQREIGPGAAAALFLPDEGTLEPRLLTSAAIAAARNRGAEFREDCSVTGLAIEDGRCRGVIAGGESISASRVVVAAGSFSSQIADSRGLVGQYAPTRPVRGQVVALRSEELRLNHVLRTAHGYLVPRHDGRIVAGSTSEEAGYAKRVTPEGIRQILDNALKILPELAGAEILDTWSGLRPGTPDDLPILGPTEIEGLLIATGHYRNGILLAAVTAKLIREWIASGRPSFPAEPFSPLRFANHHIATPPPSA